MATPDTSETSKGNQTMTQVTLFHNGAAIDSNDAAALMIDASLYKGVDIADLRETYKSAIDFSDHDSLDSMTARETLFDLADIEILPGYSDNCEKQALSYARISGHERFQDMSFQSLANIVLNESRDSTDRLIAWETLNANALDIGDYWAGLSRHARARILGAMALDLSEYGFMTGEPS